MVYTGTIATEADIALMVGENVDATGDTEANHNLLMAQAESYLCCLMKYNIVDSYAALNADVKAIFTEWAARYCAISLIAYNMAGYTSRTEAFQMINIHWARMEKIENLLKEITIDYVKGA